LQKENTQTLNASIHRILLKNFQAASLVKPFCSRRWNDLFNRYNGSQNNGL